MNKKELTPSEYEDMVSTGKSKSFANPIYIKYGVIAIVALVLCGVSFGAGISYQKSTQTTDSTAASSNDSGQFPSLGGGPGGLGNGQRPNVGQVTTILSDSITISNDRTGSNQTFTITSETTIQNNGDTVSATDIKTGDTVFIVASSSDASVAGQIMLNPNLGGMQPSG